MGTFFMSRQRLLRDTSPSLCSLREWDRPQSKAGLFANDARNTPCASFRQRVRCEHMWLPCIIIGRLQENTWEPVAYVQYANCASTQDCGQLRTYNGLVPDALPYCMNAHNCIQMRWRPLTRPIGVRSELLFGLGMQGLWQRGLAHLKAQRRRADFTGASLSSLARPAEVGHAASGACFKTSSRPRVRCFHVDCTPAASRYISIVPARASLHRYDHTSGAYSMTAHLTPIAISPSFLARASTQPHTSCLFKNSRIAGLHN